MTTSINARFAGSLCVILLCILFFAPRVSFAEEVDAEGRAPVGADRAAVEEEARGEARRIAVKKAIDVYILPDALNDDGRAAYDDVISQPDRYISGEETLDSGEEGDDYFVRLRVDVRAGGAVADMVSKLKSMCFLRKSFRKPRVMAVFSETIFGKKSEMPISETQANKFLGDVCIEIVDKAQVEMNQGVDMLKSLTYDDDVDFNNVDKMDANKLKPVLNMLLETGADWLLEGYASVDEDACSKEVVYGNEITSCRASVRVRMIEVKSGRMLAPMVVEQSSASPAGSNKAIAHDALYIATTQAMEAVLGKIVEQLSPADEDGGSCSTIHITIYGATSRQLSAFKKHITDSGEAGVCSSETVSFTDKGVAKLNVDSSLSAEKFFDLLSADTIEGLDLDVEAFTPTSIDIKVRN